MEGAVVSFKGGRPEKLEKMLIFCVMVISAKPNDW